MAKIAKIEQEEPLDKKLWKAADKLLINIKGRQFRKIAENLSKIKFPINA